MTLDLVIVSCEPGTGLYSLASEESPLNTF